MKITFFGPDNYYFDTAFFGRNGLQAISYGTATSTRIVAINSDTGAVTTITGTGFVFDQAGNVLGGTATEFSFAQMGSVVAVIDDISWNAASTFAAIVAVQNGNLAPLHTLFNAAPVTIDASNSTVALEDLAGVYDFVTHMTVLGSEFADTLAGGSGNDMIRFGNGNDAFARVSAGNDTYIYTDVTSSYSSLVYSSASRTGGITVNINGIANTGSIIKQDGVDTLVDVKNPLDAGATVGGLQLFGTRNNDVFNLNGGFDTWMSVAGAEGADTFNLTLTGWIRLNFNWNGTNAATQALEINVAAGVVTNDGYGFMDSLNVTTGKGVLQIEATVFADTLIGSAGREDFLPGQGNDTIDGGGGKDRVRYDRGGIDAVVVDLAAGTATGSGDGVVFAQQLTGIEDVRGSREGDDILKGTNKGNLIDGRGGNDMLYGRGGKDEMRDGLGDDTVYGGGGDDMIHNGGGTDAFYGGKGVDTFFSGSTTSIIAFNVGLNMKTGFHGDLDRTEGNDTIAGFENATLVGISSYKVTGNNQRNVVNTDLGDDWVAGNGGNDKIKTGAGDDTLLGGKGRDKLAGGSGNDLLKGGAAIDTLDGGKGNDKLVGGGGNDVFLFTDTGRQGRDVITDFTDGSDVIQVIGGAGFAEVTLTSLSGGDATLIELSGGTKIVLRGVDISLIDANDFDFV